MKILVISNLYPPDVAGGYELGCAQIVEALEARSHEVVVLTSVPRRPVATSDGVRRVLRLADVYHQPSFSAAPPWEQRWLDARSNLVSAFNVYELVKTLEEFDPDVVYLWNLVGLGGLGLLGSLHHVGVPWVWHLMDAVPRIICGLNGRIIPAVASHFERCFSGSYLACSRRLIEEIEVTGPKLGPSVRLVPNWIDGRDPPDRSEYMPGGSLRIVSAGRVSREKGVDVLVEAAALLHGWGYVNFSVDIFGEGDDLRSLPFDHGVQDYVRFRGFESPARLRKLFDDYDLFLFPTWEREPFGFAALEAAGRGCAVLATADCGFSEWFVHGVDCLKAPRRSESFARVIRDILDGHTDLAVIGRRAARVVWRHFHIEEISQAVEETLEEAAGGARRVPGSGAEAYRVASLAEKLLFASIRA